MIRLFTTLFIAASLAIACSKNAVTGRSQFKLLPESELQSMATGQYKDFLAQNRLVNASTNRDAEMVRRVGQRITKAVTDYYASIGKSNILDGYRWEYNLVDDKAVNAWCMPGGKIVRSE